ncbi:MAG: RidA family protein [Campylobacter sp.]|nr:RidA family protein [Campylobacter sp.]
MKKVIHTHNAPQAIGPYSQAIVANGFLFVSGQLGVNASGEFAGSDVKSQAKQSMENIKAILAAADIEFGDIVKTSIFLADINDFAAVNEIYASYFNADYPARSCVAVKSLPKNALVEIEVMAVIK